MRLPFTMRLTFTISMAAFCLLFAFAARAADSLSVPTGKVLFVYDKVDESWYNLVEDNTFAYGGHHAVGVCSRYNVIRLYDATGRKVGTLEHDGHTPGTHAAVCSAGGFSPDVYLCRMRRRRRAYGQTLGGVEVNAARAGAIRGRRAEQPRSKSKCGTT